MFHQALYQPTAVLYEPLIVFPAKYQPIAALDDPLMEFQAELPRMILFWRTHTVLFPNQSIFPLFVSLSPSTLFAFNTTSAPFVEPRKSFTPTVFPERDQSALELAAAQRAFPDASEVRT